jgi:hypothetical protein
MSIRYLLCFAYFILNACNSRQHNYNIVDSTGEKLQGKKSVTFLMPYINKYGSSKVIAALYFIDKKSVNTIVEKIDSLNLIYCQFGTFIESQPTLRDSTIIASEIYVNTIPDTGRVDLLNKLDKWLKNDMLLSSILNGNLSEDVFFEEIINTIPVTRHLIQQYLTSPNQYWGSLDENAMCKVYYDVCIYILKLNDSNRIDFFASYFSIAAKLASAKK